MRYQLCASQGTISTHSSYNTAQVKPHPLVVGDVELIICEVYAREDQSHICCFTTFSMTYLQCTDYTFGFQPPLSAKLSGDYLCPQ